mmetsp:Transcript_78932/g.144447  ORF Transcript_78932/g.144447 Transcript_78932/m.144447 type:complete len:307 (+) Transcript_78932:136-1056(+)
MHAGTAATAAALQLDKNATRVFVGGLRKTTTEDRIFAHFAKFGSVKQVELKKQPNGESRGFAFVKFVDLETVDKVMEARTQHMIDNKWVDVKRHDNNASSSAPASVVAWGSKATGGGAGGTGAGYVEEDEDEARQDEDKMAAQSMLQAAFANEMSAMQATHQVQQTVQVENASTPASASPAGGMAAGMAAGMAMGGGMMPMGMMPMGMMPMGNGMGMVMMPMMPGMMGMMNPAMMGMMNPAMMGAQPTQGAQCPAAIGPDGSAGCGAGGAGGVQPTLGSWDAIKDASSDFGPAARGSAMPDRPSPY